MHIAPACVLWGCWVERCARRSGAERQALEYASGRENVEGAKMMGGAGANVERAGGRTAANAWTVRIRSVG
jgi:hypothetical protein